MTNHFENTGCEDLPHIGADFKAVRESKFLSVNDMATALNMQAAYVSAIERLDTEALPSIGYVLGYVRSMAVHLGMDATESVNRYKSDIACPEKLGMRDAPHFVPKRHIRLPRGSIAAGTLLSCLTVVVTWYGMHTDARSAPEEIKAANAEQEWIVEKETEIKTDPDMLRLRAVGPSWVQVKDAEDNIVISKIMVPGEIFETSRKDMGQLSLRDAGAIELFIAGEPMGVLGDKGVSIDDVIIPGVKVPE